MTALSSSPDNTIGVERLAYMRNEIARAPKEAQCMLPHLEPVYFQEIRHSPVFTDVYQPTHRHRWTHCLYSCSAMNLASRSGGDMKLLRKQDAFEVSTEDL